MIVDTISAKLVVREVLGAAVDELDDELLDEGSEVDCVEEDEDDSEALEGSNVVESLVVGGGADKDDVEKSGKAASSAAETTYEIKLVNTVEVTVESIELGRLDPVSETLCEGSKLVVASDAIV